MEVVLIGLVEVVLGFEVFFEIVGEFGGEE